MNCPNCGAKNDDATNFCKDCGASMKTEEQKPQKNETEVKSTTSINDGRTETEPKYVKSIAITNIVIGAILFLLSLDSEYDWTLAPYCLGIGICVTGILQLLKKSPKIIAILQIIVGALCVLISLDMTYDWEYVGFIAGAGMLTLGILRILRKPLKIVSIVEIAFGGLSALLGLVCMGWAWGDTGLLTGATFLVEGILNIRNSKTNELKG